MVVSSGDAIYVDARDLFASPIGKPRRNAPDGIRRAEAAKHRAIKCEDYERAAAIRDYLRRVTPKERINA